MRAMPCLVGWSTILYSGSSPCRLSAITSLTLHQDSLKIILNYYLTLTNHDNTARTTNWALPNRRARWYFSPQYFHFMISWPNLMQSYILFVLHSVWLIFTTQYFRHRLSLKIIITSFSSISCPGFFFAAFTSSSLMLTALAWSARWWWWWILYHSLELTLWNSSSWMEDGHIFKWSAWIISNNLNVHNTNLVEPS